MMKVHCFHGHWIVWCLLMGSTRAFGALLCTAVTSCVWENFIGATTSSDEVIGSPESLTARGVFSIGLEQGESVRLV